MHHREVFLLCILLVVAGVMSQDDPSILDYCFEESSKDITEEKQSNLTGGKILVDSICHHTEDVLSCVDYGLSRSKSDEDVFFALTYDRKNFKSAIAKVCHDEEGVSAMVTCEPEPEFLKICEKIHDMGVESAAKGESRDKPMGERQRIACSTVYGYRVCMKALMDYCNPKASQFYGHLFLGMLSDKCQILAEHSISHAPVGPVRGFKAIIFFLIVVSQTCP